MATTWTSDRLRKTFLEFFRQRGHTIIPSASLIPENDPSTLFTTAGMHPLVPYLMGQVHPAGKRIVDVQKCIRTGDIDEVGDNCHLTFFEMLGNWSLGDYFKDDAIRWSWELLTGKEWFGLDSKRLAVTVFAGDADATRDDESVTIWKSCGVPESRIAFLGKDDNWWPSGGKHPGPQGPDTEIFYWVSEEPAPEHFDPKDERWVEIWNNVFMEYHASGVSDQQAGVAYQPLAQKNVDTGMGLERTLCVLMGKKTVFETDLFAPILERIEEFISGVIASEAKPVSRSEAEPRAAAWRSAIPVFEERPGLLRRAAPRNDSGDEERRRRVIADHLRAATFILGDPFGISPSNVDQGYVLRKLIRRAVRAGRSIGVTKSPWTPDVAEVVIAHYRSAYPELEQRRSRILFELREEEERFNESLDRGMRHFTALAASLPAGAPIAGQEVFTLYETYGFPLEITEDLAREQGRTIDRAGFEAATVAHQEQSRSAMGQRFAGGLADHSDQSIRYHTATHLLHAALREVLGDHIAQKGSNITPERLRFDFSHPQKMTPDELARVAAIVQEKIDADLPVHYDLVSVEEAKTAGAIGLFEDKYAQLADQTFATGGSASGGKVKMYVIGDAGKGYASREICGGPHVARTGMIGKFRILKEEAISQGVRRIKAVVEPTTGAVDVAHGENLTG